MSRDYDAEREATRYLLEEANTALGNAKRQITTAQNQVRRLLANLDVPERPAPAVPLQDASMAEMAQQHNEVTA